MKVAILSTYLPNKCGIATYSNDLFKSLNEFNISNIDIIAIDSQELFEYPDEVKFIIDKNNITHYETAAYFINVIYDVIIIQHEFGIYGGTDGEFILNLFNKISIPIITNFHTLLYPPSTNQKRIIQEIANKSTIVTLMTQRAVNILLDMIQIDSKKIRLIPHGVPSFDISQRSARLILNFKKSTFILLSFGFLGRGKGFETAIEAVTKIQYDNFIYIILGTTHPNVLKHEGEAYRELLINKSIKLGIQDKIIFIDEFASEEKLKTYLSATDMYVTPYPNENQISSGTLSFAVGAGAAVISTPYIYAKDLLANDVGILFDFNDSNALANNINQLIQNPQKLKYYRNQAKNLGNTMIWSIVAQQHFNILNLLNKQNDS
ncbi:glycosyltransferase family 4 protein [Sphingobacterium bovistauri]|uniref:Glycosyltransferase family 4 protein n=1 Tax=Sphingobacterium bovistauri TaxID=2781959 RepID=A0ABS7Z9P8_9SPHI|nr:glycosyltransferase family 4 protein [Sphingobacterium bovistauri]MCA5006297.1 glycosyltransferase family 4 protein [Sphingobacterium bovistauri]